MRSIRLVAVSLLACVASPSRAQLPSSVLRPEAKSAVFVELGGNAGLYSMNLDRRLRSRTTFRAALAQYTSLRDEPQKDYMRVAFMLNMLVGGPSDWLEVGLGPMGGRWTQAIRDVWFGSITSTIGFRHQTRRKGFVFRASVAPQYQFGRERDGGGASVWPGLSFGLSF